MPIMVLREYQTACNEGIKDFLLFHNRVLCEMGTGTGKSRTMSGFIHNTTGRHLVVVTGDDLVNQLHDTVQSFTGESVGIERASDKAHTGTYRIVVASIPTLAQERRRKNYHADHFDYIHYDEGDLSACNSGMKVLSHFTGAKLILWTATPFRSDKQKLPFDAVAYKYPYRQAVKDGWLVPVMFDRCPLRIDATKIRVVGGDYDVNQVDNAILPYLELAAQEIASKPDSKTLVFLPLRATSRRITDMLNSLGMRSLHVEGETKDRKKIFQAFAEGEYNVLTNAMVFGRGTDIPCANRLLNLRLTKSLSTFVQINGRILRPSESIANLLNDCPTAEERKALIASSDKPTSTIIDPLWLTKKHNMLSPPDMIAETEDERRVMLAEYRQSGRINIAKSIEAYESRPQNSLVTEIRQHEHKERELIDPLTMKEYDVDGYREEYAWQKLPITTDQIDWCKKQGISHENMSRGLAKYLYDKIVSSNDPSPAQKKKLMSLGKWFPNMDKEQATKAIEKALSKYRK